ncbi:MAG TPA: hypothetical protein VKT73_15040 [Xanthobacteraceae bacterium]|nr:hypothetical protein [Xanthobacteraceae bacterium]
MSEIKRLPAPARRRHTSASAELLELAALHPNKLELVRAAEKLDEAAERRRSNRTCVRSFSELMDAWREAEELKKSL